MRFRAPHGDLARNLALPRNCDLTNVATRRVLRGRSRPGEWTERLAVIVEVAALTSCAIGRAARRLHNRVGLAPSLDRHRWTEAWHSRPCGSCSSRWLGC